MDVKIVFLLFIILSKTTHASECGEYFFRSKTLSYDMKMSCASCHSPDNYYQDSLPLSKARSRMMLRNSPSLLNLKRYNVYSWDGRNNTLIDQIDGPLSLHLELGASELTARESLKGLHISNSDSSLQYVKNCLAEFLSKLGINKISRFEKFIKNEKTLSRSELKGYKVFREKNCISCHQLPALTDNKFHNIGVPLIRNVLSVEDGKTIFRSDLGSANVRDGLEEIYKFRTASLYNVMKTSPYMHNGTLKTIDDVLIFYSRNRAVNPKGLSRLERKSLKAFFKSLNEIDQG